MHINQKPPMHASETSYRHHQCKLTIRFPKELWNSYTIHATNIHKTTRDQKQASRKLGLRLKLKLNAPQSPIYRQTKKCKTVLWRFQPGGPKHALSGKLMNEMQLEGPCLRPTCGSCRSWHPGLIEEPEPDTELENEEVVCKTVESGMSSPAS
jgi:hypothetical protein